MQIKVPIHRNENVIYDAHVHVCPRRSLKAVTKSPSPLFGYTNVRENPWEDYRRLAIQKGVFKALLIPLPFQELPREATDLYVAEAVRRNLDLFLGVALLPANDGDFNGPESYVVGFKDHFYLTRGRDIREYFAAYDFLQQTNRVLVLHPGKNERLRRVALIKKNFPRLTVIVAHAGRETPFRGDGALEVADALKKYESIFFDTSTIRDPKVVRDLVNLVGSERVLFGSDYPYFNSREEDTYACEIEALERAGLSAKAYDDLFRNTFRNLFLNDVWVRRVAKEDKCALLKVIEEISRTERKLLAIDKKTNAIRRAINSGRHVWVLETRTEIVGFVRESGRPQRGACIEEIYVKPNHRRKGYGKRLLTTLMGLFDYLVMRTFASNTPMCRLARSLGFKIEKTSAAGTFLTWKWERL